MNLKVCYINPNPSGSNYVEFTDVGTWKSEHAELHIVKKSGHRITFASRQWVWAEESVGENENAKYVQDSGKKEVSESPRRTDSIDDYRRNDHRRVDRHNPTGERRRKADLSDLSYVTPESVENRNAASVQFAIDNRTVPWSEAHMRALLEYEQMVSAEHGPNAVLALPWNQVPRASD